MAAAFTSAVKSSPSGALQRCAETLVLISSTGRQKGQTNVHDSLWLVADVHAGRQDAPPFSEALDSVPRDHHAVVGAELSRRAEQPQPRRLGDDAQRLADVLVAGHSSREHLQVGRRTLR